MYYLLVIGLFYHNMLIIVVHFSDFTMFFIKVNSIKIKVKLIYPHKLCYFISLAACHVTINPHQRNVNMQMLNY